MQIMIDIPEEIYNSACVTNNIWDMRMAGFVCSAIANGTPLPKGHGRLIDADVLKTAFPCGESVRTECVRATINYAPTIIELDKGESEG